MSKVQITDFDISQYLETEEDIAEYLSAILEENDTQLLLASIGDIAKAKGMSKIASDTGLGRESLYKALNSDAKPRFETILKVLGALGLNLSFTPRNSLVSSRKKATKNSKAKRIKSKTKKHINQIVHT